MLFGLVYLAIGLDFLTGAGNGLRRRIRTAPEASEAAQNAALQGAAFGLNIPARLALLRGAVPGLIVANWVEGRP